MDVSGKRVLLRADLNVTFVPGTTQIADDGRIKATLPTIDYLKEQGAGIILCSHLGRPKGQVVEEMRLAPVADRLMQLLGGPVKYVKDCIGPEVEEAARELKPGDVLLLENLRFHAGEEKNDPEFARCWLLWLTFTWMMRLALLTAPTPPFTPSRSFCPLRRVSR